MVPFKEILRAKSAIIIILAPIILLPVPIFYTTKAGRCAYGLLIMAIYWMTEALPIAATGLIPIALFPWLGVASSTQLCMNYLKDTNVLFLGGLMVAVAVEKWKLHKRIALRVLLIVGSQPKWLMFGFMSTTAFLSMWISNTATTAMMVPIAQAVLKQLETNTDDEAEDEKLDAENSAAEKDYSFFEKGNIDDEKDSNRLKKGSGEKVEMERIDPVPSFHKNVVHPKTFELDVKVAENPVLRRGSSVQKEKHDKMRKGMTLCICYAANVGGTATLTGTGPNLVLKGQVDTLFGPQSGINFSSWLIFAFPNMLISLLFTWFWLQLIFLGYRETLCMTKRSKNEGANKVIREEYQKLGPMTFAEKGVLAHFIILAVLWITREPEFVPGWSYLFPEGYVTDASVAITIAVLLFMFPSRRPNYWCYRKKTDTEPPGAAPGLLDWQSVQDNLSWGVIIVLGGGFALADACKESGLSSDISELFKNFGGIPPWALIFGLCLITATFTEVASNVATATIFLPILAELGISIGMNPLYLMIPVTLATSFAFMLPVATPPNAIVFAFGHLKVIDMVKTGAMLNVVCVCVLQLAINTWGYAFFNLGTFPEWAGGNRTTSMLAVNASISYISNSTISP